MNKIATLTNKYPLSKTLRFRLLPVGKTLENFKAQKCLELDEQRATDYAAVKGIMDRNHRAFIEKVLKDLKIKGVEEYAALFYNPNKSDSDKKRMIALADDMRKQISVAFTRHEDFPTLRPFDMIGGGLSDYVADKTEAEQVENFRGFTSYFTGFHDVRQNLYSAEDKHSAISARCISENLPRFLTNAKAYSQIIGALDEEAVEALIKDFAAFCDSDMAAAFDPANFSAVLSQQGIDKYNTIIGGYTLEDGTKVRGINEYANMYNQVAPRGERLPLLVPLYKQMMSEQTTFSFVPDGFTSDADILLTLNESIYGDGERQSIMSILDSLESLITTLPKQDASRIFVKAGSPITSMSLALCGDFMAFSDAWNSIYDAEHMGGKPPKNMAKYIAVRKETQKKINSYSLSDLQAMCNRAAKKPVSVTNHIVTQFLEAKEKFSVMHTAATAVLCREAGEEKRLMQDGDAVARIKDMLDSIKEINHAVRPLLGAGDETKRDGFFYSMLVPYCDALAEVDRLYDRVRNYLTQKPYSNEKIKLNFGNAAFLGGWAAGYESSYSSRIFRCGEKIYLAVMDKGHKSYFKDFPAPKSDSDVMEVMVYNQVASASKDIPSLMVIDGVTQRRVGRKEKTGPHAGENVILEELKEKHLPAEINRIRKSRSFSVASEDFSKADLTAYIDFYKERVTEYYSQFSFEFKPSEEYANFAEFTADVDAQAYQVRFEPVSKKHIETLVDIGAIYLFQLYNKDFSEYSKGTPNLHTLYFRMLFDERNLKNVHYQLCGGAEMFYRKASVAKENMVVHPANQPVKNKNPLNTKKESTFAYDLVKNRRYTEDQFFLHLPLTINGNSEGKKNINADVRTLLVGAGETNIIGITRSEENLLYICVINSKGEILEQQALNVITSGTADAPNKRDYKELLSRLDEEKRDASRAWQSAKASKDVKLGYLSQVVNKVCQLVEKYDAIIVMEDMNHGGKGAYLLENDVYKAFEKMLIDKLNFYVRKSADVNEPGGLLNAYQLTNKFESFQKLGRQNGIIFYVNGGMTANVDPATGFIDFLRPRYTTEAAARTFFSSFEDIRYNAHEDHFEFSFNYDDFPGVNFSSRKAWTVCTNGDRVSVYRNRMKNTVSYNDVDVTGEIKYLLKEKGISYAGGENLVDDIVSQSGKEFFSKLLSLLALALKMRNYDGVNSYFISPVRGEDGYFYDSRDYGEDSMLPSAADGVTAYNMARKALPVLAMLCEAPEETLAKTNIFLSFEDWLRFAQN